MDRRPRQSHFRGLSDALRWSLERGALASYLRAEDRNSMAHGIEVRLPFLDHRLVSLAFRLGSDWKMRGEYTKVLLRQAMHGRIPETVRTRVQKFGFPTALNRWFRADFYGHCRDLLGSRAVRESGLWNIRPSSVLWSDTDEGSSTLARDCSTSCR